MSVRGSPPSWSPRARWAAPLPALLLAFHIGGVASAGEGAKEIREYQGQRLDPFDRGYDNSIGGPRKVDAGTYRITIDGAVAEPLSMTCREVLASPSVKRLVTLHCVEGWSERILFEVVAEPKYGYKWVKWLT